MLVSKHTAVSVSLLYVQSATSIEQYLFGCCMYSLQQAYSSIWLLYVQSATSIEQYLFGCCMYSLELLMMDGKTVRNMYSVILK